MPRMEVEKIENYRIDLDTTRNKYYVYKLSDDNRFSLEKKCRGFEEAVRYVNIKLGRYITFGV